MSSAGDLLPTVYLLIARENSCTRYGIYCLMTNLCRPMKTGSLSHAETASLGRYTPNSSRIPQTIRKSSFLILAFISMLLVNIFQGLIGNTQVLGQMSLSALPYREDTHL